VGLGVGDGIGGGFRLGVGDIIGEVSDGEYESLLHNIKK
jgi:hypothetical protein